MWVCLWLARGRLSIGVVVGEVGCPGVGQEMTVQVERVRKTGCLKECGRSGVLKYAETLEN